MRKVFYFLLSGSLLAGCGNPFGGHSSNVDANHDPGQTPSASAPVVFTGVSSSGLASSAAQSVYTLSNNHIVQATLGELSQGSFYTLASGKQVFIGTQGILISQDQNVP